MYHTYPELGKLKVGVEETLTRTPPPTPVPATFLSWVLGHLTYISGLQGGRAGNGLIGTDLIGII